MTNINSTHLLMITLSHSYSLAVNKTINPKSCKLCATNEQYYVFLAFGHIFPQLLNGISYLMINKQLKRSPRYTRLDLFVTTYQMIQRVSVSVHDLARSWCLEMMFQQELQQFKCTCKEHVQCIMVMMNDMIAISDAQIDPVPIKVISFRCLTSFV